MFSIIVIFTTVRIMKESLSVLLDAVPNSIKLSDLNEELSRIDGVWYVFDIYNVELFEDKTKILFNQLYTLP